MSSQSVKIKKFSDDSLLEIGTAVKHQPNSLYYKIADGDFKRQWEQIISSLNATYKKTKVTAAFEELIITSDLKFFKSLDYIKGDDLPQKLQEFFNDCYKFALAEIGYHNKDCNIISAAIVFVEPTPQLQVFYIPIVDRWQERVYARDKQGKILRNEHGSPIQARSEFGMIEYNNVYSPAQPKICSSSFWAERGKKHAYCNLQDDFYDLVGSRYNLARK